MTVIGLRCTSWNPQVQGLYQQLQPCADRVVVLPDARTAGPCPAGLNVEDWAPVLPALLPIQADRLPANYGWRCGDLAFYTLQRHLEQLGVQPSFFWLVEPDVAFLMDPLAFFAPFQNSDTDFLAQGIRPSDESSMWHASMVPYGPVMRCQFPLVRLSRRALALCLLRRRQQLADSVEPDKDCPNDEALVCSTVFNAGMSVATLEQTHPGCFRYFSTTAAYPDTPTFRQHARGQVVHSLRDWPDFEKKHFLWKAKYVEPTQWPAYFSRRLKACQPWLSPAEYNQLHALLLARGYLPNTA